MKYSIHMSGPAVRFIRAAVPIRIRQYFKECRIPLGDFGGDENAYAYYKSIPGEMWPFEVGFATGDPDHDLVGHGFFDGVIMGWGKLGLKVVGEDGRTVFEADEKGIEAMATERWGGDEDTSALRGGENGGVWSWHEPCGRDTPEKEESSRRVEEFWRDHACYEAVEDSEFKDEAVSDADFTRGTEFEPSKLALVLQEFGDERILVAFQYDGVRFPFKMGRLAGYCRVEYETEEDDNGEYEDNEDALYASCHWIKPFKTAEDGRVYGYLPVNKKPLW